MLVRDINGTIYGVKLRWPSRYGSQVSLEHFPESGWHFAVMINGRYWAFSRRGVYRFDNIWRRTGTRLVK